MDGFTSIPIQNAGVPGATAEPKFSTAPYKDNSVETGSGIEIVDESEKKKTKQSFGFLLPLSLFSLFVVFGYFGYLVFTRYVTLEQISILNDKFQALTTTINKSEIDEFIALDNSLRVINQKMNTHTQLAGILGFVNQNIRNTVQITDYRIESREKEVSVGLVSVAPSFKDLAEQTEKMADLKVAGAIKDFRVTQMALEADGRRVRYTLNLIFDKSKISVAAIAAQN